MGKETTTPRMGNGMEALASLQQNKTQPGE